MRPFQLSFFSHLFNLFRVFSRQVEKEVQGLAPEPYKYTKTDPKGAQTEPKSQQIQLQGVTKYEKPVNLSSKGGKVERQVLQWRPRALQCARKT